MNMWLQANTKRVEKIKRQLIEYSYAGSYGGTINLMEVNSIIDGLLIEVTKLDKENRELKDMFKRMQQEHVERTKGDFKTIE